MKNPDIAVYIHDMKNSAEKIFKLVDGATSEQFKNNLMLHLAVERLFEIIGEAANRIPKDIQQKYSLIPWSKIIGLRNLIIHAYDTVNSERLFAVIQEDLKTLIAELNKIR
ncbi:MAG: DUF86 domain-containing protein [Heliobacteriaceae bacterium]|jgi:uncharacterized protein with HEPN domain|nr:DUF86 domain-containing protein [Heliobacteriaceae bacterium]